MKHAYVFPGQGAQAVGMGKELYDNVPAAKALFEQANEILGFRITDIMFAGTDEELKQTKVTQPAVFLHSVIMAKALGVKPDAVAGQDSHMMVMFTHVAESLVILPSKVKKTPLP